ncbi:hypothetical protein JHK84_055847 [Glycine max]|nr:hypothetical protein JHK84_055847 [Glycine max]
MKFREHCGEVSQLKEVYKAIYLQVGNQLPHILSESSLYSTPRSEYSNFFATAPTSKPLHPPLSTTTPSQAYAETPSHPL